MDFDSEIKKVLKDGKVLIGERSVKKSLLLGKAKLVIVAANTSERLKEDLKRYAQLSKIKYYEYSESARELGYKCAKPFPVSSLAVVDDGGSSILKITK